MKISRDTMQGKLKSLSISKLEEIATVNFNRFMRAPEEKVYYDRWANNTMHVNSIPSNFSNLVMFWIADSLVQNQEKVEDNGETIIFPKETKTTRTLYDFVELYADIVMEPDKEITLNFPGRSDEEDYGRMIETIIKAFKVKYAEKIKAYESYKATKKEEIDFLFRQVAEKEPESE